MPSFSGKHRCCLLLRCSSTYPPTNNCGRQTELRNGEKCTLQTRWRGEGEKEHPQVVSNVACLMPDNVHHLSKSSAEFPPADVTTPPLHSPSDNHIQIHPSPFLETLKKSFIPGGLPPLLDPLSRCVVIHGLLSVCWDVQYRSVMLTNVTGEHIFALFDQFGALRPL